jgi:ATP-dependent RNA helicase RhlE
MTTTFADLGLTQKFLDALNAKWYTHPTPIQEQSIPIILAGHDIFGCAQTGTGKTASFCLPTLQLLDQTGDPHARSQDKKIRSLILTPTRELAVQIGENLREYGKRSNLTSTVIFGGVSQVPQVKALQKGVDILVATPGRLLDLINQKYIKLHKVQIFTLDEADRMLDMWFINDIKKITKHIPAQRQTLFFSATIAPSIMELAHTYLKNPKQVTIAPESPTVDTVKQSLYTLAKDHKKELLLHLLQDKKIKSAVVFTKTKHGANKVTKILEQAKIPSAAIHGNKSQAARQRALASLKDGSIRVLVATDVAARGIDIDELSHVIIYDVPLEEEVYVHRIGRTGRAGLKGHALMFCEPEETKYLRQITRLIKKDIPLIVDHPFHLDIDLDSNRSPAKPQGRGGSGRPGRSSRPSRSNPNKKPGAGNKRSFGWNGRGRKSGGERSGSRKR